MSPEPNAPAVPPLERRLTLFPATALNMANMIGVGPFITIPLLMSALGGPQSLLGWLVALVITLPDALVWSELGAALPGSGGTYRWLLEGFGPRTWGKLMAFLFIWQFIISGPMEIASGYIGVAQYLDYLSPGMSAAGKLTLKGGLVVVALGLLNIILLYRRISGISRLMITLWVGVMLTVGIVLVGGALNFDPHKAFDFPANPWAFSSGFLLGLGTATRIGLYDFLGYYDICYLGDEVKNPGRTIPRAVITSLVAVALIYVGINLSINGVISWREFVPAEDHPQIANFIGSIFIERLYGPKAAAGFTLLVVWTALGSVFALLLGYSRIPFAAAQDGTFFRIFAKVHPRGHFPHVALVVIGVLAIAASFVSLPVVIDTLIAARILIQFVGQIVALVLLRRHRPQLARPYKLWLYPLPLFVAGLGWLLVFATTPPQVIGFALGALALGVAGYFAWAKVALKWPFAPAETPAD
ncbi:MAG TPA: APC family permease [Candidatus Limnocylindria bacterium]|nr:APC family permease [Candidatus Limnocylindria bacterium]